MLQNYSTLADNFNVAVHISKCLNSIRKDVPAATAMGVRGGEQLQDE